MVASQWEPEEFAGMKLFMGEYCDYAGTISYYYPSFALGIDCQAAMYKDHTDCCLATWAALQPVWMALPEYEVVLILNPGDVLTFNSSETWHAMIRPPDNSFSMNISLYCSSVQREHFRRAKAEGKVDSGFDVEFDL